MITITITLLRTWLCGVAFSLLFHRVFIFWAYSIYFRVFLPDEEMMSDACAMQRKVSPKSSTIYCTFEFFNVLIELVCPKLVSSSANETRQPNHDFLSAFILAICARIVSPCLLACSRVVWREVPFLSYSRGMLCPRKRPRLVQHLAKVEESFERVRRCQRRK